MVHKSWTHLLLALALAISATAQSSANRDPATCSTTMDSTLPNPTPTNFHFSGNIRRYYIAAEPVSWNYAPTGWDNYLGVPIDVSPRAQEAGYIKRLVWEKALYRGYTDASFTQYSSEPPWQGTLGPTLRAEVGDLIEILFLNKLSANYASMHSMGLMYNKPSEGGDYPNNTVPGQESPFSIGNAVPPGGCVVYKWMVDDSSGPYGNDPAKAHSYHSYVDLQQDTNAGLIGPTIIYAPGRMASTIAQYREFPLLFMAYSESDSFMSKINNQGNSSSNNYRQQAYGKSDGGASSYTDSLSSGNYGNRSIWNPQLTNLLSSGQGMGTTFWSINGYVLANNPTFEICLNDQVIWYVLAYGSMSHVFHLHGNSVRYNGDWIPSISINDGVQRTLYMNATGAGKWQAVCHVGFHNTLGMVANYRVYQDNCPLQPL